jgi:porin
MGDSINNSMLLRAAYIAALFGVATSAQGQESPAAPSQPSDAHATEAHETPNYSGDWRTREYLSGDWNGQRTKLAEQGLTFDLSWTQVTQGVVDGGRRRDWDYGGNFDFLATADLGKLGLIEGGTLTFRGESRYGETVNDDTGAFTPVNTRGYFPLTNRINQGIPFTITELTYSQALCDTLEITIGKMLTAAGDPVEFAGGLGRTQFLNSNFIYNAATSQTAPYSTLGAAIDWTPKPGLTLSTALFATTDSSTTTGFDHLNDGWTWWSQISTQYRLGKLPGGMNAGFQYAFGNQFTAINDKLTLIPGGGVGLPTVSDSWAVFWGGWQYLYTPDEAPEEIDASDDHADIRGLGLFARFGFADRDTNPVHWSASIGLGGRGILPGRDNDSFGVGYYYTDVQNSPVFTALRLASSTQGFEAYYDIAITPATNLTLDIQWVDGGLPNTNAATVVGVRLNVNF